MRRASKVDRNHSEIVAAFRKLGYSVISLAACGHGIPDILAGKRGTNLLAEVKDGNKPPSARKLTEDQEKFWREWKGRIILIESVYDVLEYDRKHYGPASMAGTQT